MMRHVFGPNTRRCADGDRRSSHRYVSRKVAAAETSSLVDLKDTSPLTMVHPAPSPPHILLCVVETSRRRGEHHRVFEKRKPWLR